MRRILSITALLALVCSMAFAQSLVGPVAPATHSATVMPVGNQLTANDFSRIRNYTQPAGQGSNRTIQNVNLSYFQYADTMSVINNDSLKAFYWGINRNFPDDSFNTLNTHWSAVLFDSIVDYSTLQSYDYPTSAPLMIDSLDFYFRYNNTTATTDTIIFAVYVYDTATGIFADSISITNTPAFTDTLYVNQTINSNNLSVYTTVPSSAVPVTSTQRFAAAVYFKGNTANDFQMPASYTKPCTNACYADDPYIFNSAYWMIYWIGSSRVSAINPGVYFDCDGSMGLTQGGCEQFPLQNFFISAYVRFDDQLGGLAPIADFSGTPLSITVGQSVAFTDLSQNSPTSWQWGFQGPTILTSTLQNPTMTFNTAGLYSVALVATNAFGSDTAIKTNYILVNPASTGGCDTLGNVFTTDTANLYGITGVGGLVTGNNDFGDLAKAEFFSNTTPGQVTDVAIGLYVVASGGASSSVNVTVWDADGTAGAPGTVLTTEPILLSAINTGLTTVNFSSPASVTGNFYVGIQLTYGVGDTVGIIHTQDRTPATAWEQDAGGTWTAIATSWSFNTSLYVFPKRCANSTTLAADFTANQTNISVGGSVNFTDLTTGSPTSWNWTFPGGAPGTGTAQNPTNIVYNAVGDYDVTLIVNDGVNSDTLTKPNYIHVTAGGTVVLDCDTFGNIFTTDTANLFGVAGGGYVSGHNSFGDLAKADFFTNQLPGSDIDQAVLFFAIGDDGGNGNSINVVVWDNTGTGGSPGSVLASEPVTYATIAADVAAQQPTVVSFTTPAAPAGDYYLGIQFTYASGDTVALIHTQDRGTGQLNTAWEEWGNNTWYAYNDASSWGFAMSHYIFPIQCDTVVCPTITASFTSSDATCTASDGSLTASGSGGTAPYTYAWGTSPIQTGGVATSLAAGSYTVTITDANGCTGTASGTVGTTTSNISANVSPQDATCLASDGSAMSSPSGGTAPYTYSWSSGGAGSSVSGLAAGSYSVTVTDSKGCTATANFSIGSTSGNVTATTSSTDATCTASDGTATASPSGGATPYTYAWSSGGTSNVETGLAGGTYTVTITDNNGCTLTETVTVNVNNGSIASTTTTTNATCGNADGTATVNVSGSTGGLTYAWSSGATTATATGLMAGTYTVTVTDANGCQTTNTATVSDPGSPQITPSGGSNVSCFGGSDGSVSVTVTGGTAPYTYTWSVGGSNGPINSGLSAGVVGLTVTDLSGCSGTYSTTITQPASALTASISGTRDLSCAGANTGFVAVAASGGTTPYTYAWSTSPTQTGDTAMNLGAGTYTVTVTDAGGCTATATGTVGSAANPVSVSVNSSQTGGCGQANASLTASVTNGATPYSYLWSNGQTAATAINLAAGIYTVTVTDAGGCTTSGSGTVSDPGAHTVSSSTSAVTCYNAGNGSITITASGGSGNYSYNWSPAVAGSGSNTANNLDGGTYTITVTDNVSNCAVPTTVVLYEPDSIDVTITKSNVTCFGGSNGTVTASASGGNGGPYTYTWQPSGTTGSTLTGQSAGTVILQIEDNNSCTKNVTVTISQPTAITLNISKTDVACHGGSDGSATVSASGGAGNFSYVWSTTPSQTGPTASGLAVGSYTVTATDDNGCTASQSVTIAQPNVLAVTISKNDVTCAGANNGSATASATGGSGVITYAWSTVPPTSGASVSNLAAGGYSVTATDANGCTATATTTIGQPSALSLSITSTTNVTCSGGSDGSATASGSGGTGLITYAWSTNPQQTSATATGLSAGTYTVTATDANGCSTSATASIGAGATITATATPTSATCNGGTDGSATISATGGATPYTYSWSSGGSAATESGLAAGTYTFTVTDNNGCSKNGSVVVGQASSITVTPSPVAATCNGGTDGAINLVTTGGAGNYTYNWSNSTTNQNLTGVGAGTYAVTVTDGNGCSTTATNLVVNEASAITVTASATNETATGANDGTATATASGGTGLVTFSWSNGSTGGNLTGLAPDTYTVTATDASGCEAVETVTVSPYTGYADINAITNFDMFPNPTNGEVSMTIELTKPELVTVEWYNVIGERITNRSYENVTSVNDKFDLGDLAEGMYFARVTVNGDSFIRKVIVNK